MIAESEHSVQMEADVADTSVTYSDRAYFLLDLKFPDLKTERRIRKNNNTETNCDKLPRFGFVRLLQDIHGKDLIKNNRFLSISASQTYRKRDIKKSTVCHRRN